MAMIVLACFCMLLSSSSVEGHDIHTDNTVYSIPIAPTSLLHPAYKRLLSSKATAEEMLSMFDGKAAVYAGLDAILDIYDKIDVSAINDDDDETHMQNDLKLEISDFNRQLKEFETQKRHLLSASDSPKSSVPLSVGLGTLYLTAWVGSPSPQRVTLIVDTGSSLTAFPCTGCDSCGEEFHTDPYFDPSQSHSFYQITSSSECTSQAKFQSNPSVPSLVQGTILQNACINSQKYDEGSSWHGYEAKDLFYCGLNSSPSSTSTSTSTTTHADFTIPFIFNCQYQVTGPLRNQLANGVIGFSPSEGTLPYEMRHTHIIKSKTFSICIQNKLTLSQYNDNDDPFITSGVLTLGGIDPLITNLKPMKYAHLLHDFKYTIEFKAIYMGFIYDEEDEKQLGDTKYYLNLSHEYDKLNQDDVIIDSGTTDTFLQTHIQSEFEKQWMAITNIPYTNQKIHIEPLTLNDFPTIVLQIGGTEYTDDSVTYEDTLIDKDKSMHCINIDAHDDVFIEIKPHNYMEKDANNEGFYTPRIYFGPRTIIGANAMMGYNVHFDNKHGIIGFAMSDCTSKDFPATTSTTSTTTTTTTTTTSAENTGGPPNPTQRSLPPTRTLPPEILSLDTLSPTASRSSSTFTSKPTLEPSSKSTSKPTPKPSTRITSKPTPKPSTKITSKPTPKPSTKITSKPTHKPSTRITSKPTPKPTSRPIKSTEFINSKESDCILGEPILKSPCIDNVKIDKCNSPSVNELHGFDTWEMIVESYEDGGTSCEAIGLRTNIKKGENSNNERERNVYCNNSGLCILMTPCFIQCNDVENEIETFDKAIDEIVKEEEENKDFFDNQDGDDCGSNDWSECLSTCKQTRVISQKLETNGICIDVMEETRLCHIDVCGKNDPCLIPFKIHLVIGFEGKPTTPILKWTPTEENLLVSAISETFDGKSNVNPGDIAIISAERWETDDDKSERIAQIIGTKVVIEISIFNPKAIFQTDNSSSDRNTTFATGIKNAAKGIVSRHAPLATCTEGQVLEMGKIASDVHVQLGSQNFGDLLTKKIKNSASNLSSDTFLITLGSPNRWNSQVLASWTIKTEGSSFTKAVTSINKDNWKEHIAILIIIFFIILCFCYCGVCFGSHFTRRRYKHFDSLRNLLRKRRENKNRGNYSQIVMELRDDDDYLSDGSLEFNIVIPEDNQRDVNNFAKIQTSKENKFRTDATDSEKSKPLVLEDGENYAEENLRIEEQLLDMPSEDTVKTVEKKEKSEMASVDLKDEYDRGVDLIGWDDDMEEKVSRLQII